MTDVEDLEPDEEYEGLTYALVSLPSPTRRTPDHPLASPCMNGCEMIGEYPDVDPITPSPQSGSVEL